MRQNTWKDGNVDMCYQRRGLQVIGMDKLTKLRAITEMVYLWLMNLVVGAYTVANHAGGRASV